MGVSGRSTRRLMQRGRRRSSRARLYEFPCVRVPSQNAGAHDQRTQDRAARRIGGRTHYGQCLLQHMVRNIVGALIYVGTGRERPEWIAEVLAAKSRDAAAPTFSPAGLYLTGGLSRASAFASAFVRTFWQSLLSEAFGGASERGMVDQTC